MEKYSIYKANGEFLLNVNADNGKKALKYFDNIPSYQCIEIEGVTYSYSYGTRKISYVAMPDYYSISFMGFIKNDNRLTGVYIDTPYFNESLEITAIIHNLADYVIYFINDKAHKAKIHYSSKDYIVIKKQVIYLKDLQEYKINPDKIVLTTADNAESMQNTADNAESMQNTADNAESMQNTDKKVLFGIFDEIHNNEYSFEKIEDLYKFFENIEKNTYIHTDFFELSNNCYAMNITLYNPSEYGYMGYFEDDKEISIPEYIEKLTESFLDVNTNRNIYTMVNFKPVVKPEKSDYFKLDVIRNMLGDICNKSELFDNDYMIEIREKIIHLIGIIEDDQTYL